MLEWLIIGGGIHGTHLSLVLTKRLGIAEQRVRVLDPYPEPLHRWHEITQAVGMDYLRSPQVHNLHYDQGSLGVFARIHQQDADTRFIPAYARPSLALFNRHSAYLIDKFGLAALRVRGTAQRLTEIGGGWRVETEHGALDARRVLLAVGVNDEPHMPAWAQDHASARHVFMPGFRRDDVRGTVVVVGGGLTAVQLALALARDLAQTCTVVLLMRHPLRIYDFDSDPCWQNAICLKDFLATPDPAARRQQIAAARHVGSVPPNTAKALEAARAEGALSVIQAQTLHAEGHTLTLADGSQIHADHVLLATGSTRARPGGTWIDQAILEYNLPTAACGYPDVWKSLCWRAGLVVSGALAELALGPAARNIVGARMAGERLAATC